jgi:hypothetical protein
MRERNKKKTETLAPWSADLFLQRNRVHFNFHSLSVHFELAICDTFLDRNVLGSTFLFSSSAAYGGSRWTAVLASPSDALRKPTEASSEAGGGGGERSWSVIVIMQKVAKGRWSTTRFVEFEQNSRTKKLYRIQIFNASFNNYFVVLPIFYESTAP